MAQRPFIATVHKAIDAVTPLSLASTSWDNVGLIIEAPPSKLSSELGSSKRIVMCAIDLTRDVCREATEAKAATLVLYHPPIFGALKALTMSNPLQRSLLECVANGTSVWSIHTAADNCADGTNDHLARSIASDGHDVEELRAIEPVSQAKATTERGTEGVGRILTFKKPVEHGELVERIKKALDRDTVQIARGDRQLQEYSTVAICVGSGGSVLKGVEADVYLTGEMSHHEVLAAKAAGTTVILCNHSATERPWLKTYVPRLQAALEQLDSSLEWQVVQSKTDAEPLSSV